MLTDQEMRDRMQNGWRMGAPETVCGNGSTMQNTANVRNWLPSVVEKYGISTVNDAGAGDLYWIQKVNWNVEYRAFDLIPRRDSVTRIDITTEPLPACDAILCRMVLNHLVAVVDDDRDEERIRMALDLFKGSADYLIATQFYGPFVQRAPQFARLDLRQYLGDPLEEVQDGVEQACRLALWSL